jgi:hypothetical protein
MKISESGCDNAKFLSEFLFWITAEIMGTIQYDTVRYNTINQSPRVRLRCPAPSKDHLVNNLVVGESLVCPNRLPVIRDVVYTEPAVEAVITVPKSVARTQTTNETFRQYTPNFPVSSKGAKD